MSAPEFAPKPNIFSLYEKNIGIIREIIADELKEAEQQYPEAWIEEASGKQWRTTRRNWQYIEAILKRWETEGKDDGESLGTS